MIQLAFQPAFDPHHAMFRYFVLRPLLPQPVEVERYRVVDYYLCFPEDLVGFRFTSKLLRLRKIGERYAEVNRFEAKPSAALLLSRMKHIQLAALQTLELNEYVEGLDSGLFSQTDEAIPSGLADRVVERRERDRDLIDVLGHLLADFGLLGPNGLKARSGLLDFRYDAI